MDKLCGVKLPGGLWFCTKPAGHQDAEHVATVGPWTPTAKVLARWPR